MTMDLPCAFNDIYGEGRISNTVHISALQLNGNVSDYLVDLGHFLGQESHDIPGLIILIISIQEKTMKSWAFWPMALLFI